MAYYACPTTCNKKIDFLLNSVYNLQKCDVKLEIGLDPLTDLETTLRVTKSSSDDFITFTKSSFEELIKKSNEISLNFQSVNSNVVTKCGSINVDTFEYENITLLRLHYISIFSKNYDLQLFLNFDEWEGILSYSKLIIHHFEHLTALEEMCSNLRDVLCDTVYDLLEDRCDGCKRLSPIHYCKDSNFVRGVTKNAFQIFDITSYIASNNLVVVKENFLRFHLEMLICYPEILVNEIT
jgi:hypothetical protein